VLDTLAQRPPLYNSKASYMGKAFGPLDVLIAHAKQVLRGRDFDTMVGRGLSGALVVPVLARAMNKHWAIVRKDDGSHSSRKVEGTIGGRWIFVDDFVAGGSTRAAVRRAVAGLCLPTEFVGTYQYERDEIPESFIPES